MSTPLVRATFAVLALVTVAGFIVVQGLKAELPLVLNFRARPPVFSPGDDGIRDRTQLRLELSENAKVSFYVVDSEGRQVRTIVDERPLTARRRYRFGWDGRDDAGRLVSDGVYRMRVVRRDQGRVINSLREVRVDTRPPVVRIVSARPGVVAPGSGSAVEVRLAGERGRLPWFEVFRTDGRRPRLVAGFRGYAPRRGSWDVSVAGGGAAPEGDYAFAAHVRDAAGNLAVVPARVPSRRRARPGTGVAVRAVSLQGPLSVAEPGATVRLRVGPGERSFDFTLRRLGERRALRRGSLIGGPLPVRIPRRARTGLYEVVVRSGGREVRWPLALAGLPPGGRAATRARPLVVLPALSWQGMNVVDGDLDGFAETLEQAGSVALDRPFAAGALPPGLRAQAAPLLGFLDRAGLPYDLTTDVSLYRGRGPALGYAAGVAFAGDARWLPRALTRRLRRYVAGGGRLASFGAGSFRRSVTLAGGVARDPSPPRAVDAFGERTAPLLTDEAPLVVERDRLRVFGAGDRFVGGFSVFERSLGLSRDRRPLSAAGRDPGEPAFVGYRYGRGLVIRSGTPQWSRELERRRLGVEVPAATRRIWRLLAGRGG